MTHSITTETEARIRQDAEFFDRMQNLTVKVLEGKTDRELLRAEAATIMRDIYKAEYQSDWHFIFDHAFGPIEQFQLEEVTS